MKDRQSLRKVVDSVLRIQIEPNNDAIVLNVSDGGFSFRALKPVIQLGTVHFSYFDNGQRMNASGQLVWMDSEKLTGGLNFASVPRVSREHFQKWVAQSLKESTLPGNDAPPRNAAAGSYSALPNLTPVEPPRFMLPMDEPQPATSEWDREFRYPRPPSRFFPGFITGVVVTAIALVVLFFFYGNSADAVRDQLRQRAGLSPTPQIAPPVTPPAPAPPPKATSNASGATSSPTQTFQRPQFRFLPLTTTPEPTPRPQMQQPRRHKRKLTIRNLGPQPIPRTKAWRREKTT